MNDKIDTLKAAGLIEFWRYQDNDKALQKTKISKYPKVLTLNHLNVCFYILLFGWLLSLIIFIYESLHKAFNF